MFTFFTTYKQRYEKLAQLADYDKKTAFDKIRKTDQAAAIKSIEKEYYQWVGLHMYHLATGEPFTQAVIAKNIAFQEKARKKIVSIAKKLYL